MIKVRTGTRSASGGRLRDISFTAPEVAGRTRDSQESGLSINRNFAVNILFYAIAMVRAAYLLDSTAWGRISLLRVLWMRSVLLSLGSSVSVL
jgi:hypothetical protein